jgi:hypothetical protein
MKNKTRYRNNVFKSIVEEEGKYRLIKDTIEYVSNIVQLIADLQCNGKHDDLQWIAYLQLFQVGHGAFGWTGSSW